MKTITITILFVLILSGCAKTDNNMSQREYIEAVYRCGYVMGLKDGVEAGKNAALYGIKPDLEILMNESWKSNKQIILGK